LSNVCKRSTTVDIEYSMHDQLCDVISYCACSCGTYPRWNKCTE